MKDSEILSRLRSSIFSCGSCDIETAQILVHIGKVSLWTKKYTFAGNCLREAYNMFKSVHTKDYIALLSAAEKAYVSYTKAYKNDNRILMLQEIISLIETHKTLSFLFPTRNLQITTKHLGICTKKQTSVSSRVNVL